MYWPSTSKDGEFVFLHQEGEFLDPDEVLGTYHDWRDSSEWPVSEREGEAVRREMKKAENPEEKKGVIGAFCRTYAIEDAIETVWSATTAGSPTRTTTPTRRAGSCSMRSTLCASTCSDISTRGAGRRM